MVTTRNVLPWYIAALALVLLRCVPSMWFEHLDFDSDQAVIGLMAKHLAEGRHFPLFFYGQHYMLGVQAWLAAPFFLIGGPTVAMLRLPLLIINLIVVFWLMTRLLVRGVRAWIAFVVTLPLIAPGVLASLRLMSALGASIEPFLSVLLLWWLRRRAFLFGAFFAIAYLHREFVLFALPALVIAQLFETRRLDHGLAVHAGVAAAGFACVWFVIAVLTTRINTLGPAGGEFSPGSLVAQSRLMTMRLAWNGSAYAARFRALGHDTLPNLFAMRTVPSWLVDVKSKLEIGSAAGGVALVAATILALVGIVRAGGDDRSGDGFYLYLALIAVATIAVYPLNGGIDPATPGVSRYVLFALLLPIALLGACALRQQRSSALMMAIAFAIAIWAGANVLDNVRLIREYVVAPPPNNYRQLADYLVSHRIRYGRADYWDAYIVDFLSREQVVLAATAFTRIGSYEARVERNAANAVDVQRQPCDTGVRVALWCVDDPLHR